MQVVSHSEMCFLVHSLIVAVSLSQGLPICKMGIFVAVSKIESAGGRFENPMKAHL